MAAQAAAYRYARAGPLQTVLKKETAKVAPLANQVVVEIQAAPMHRVDAALINGSALGRLRKDDPLYTPFPRVGGAEGIGKVVAAGADAKRVKAGDLVWVAPPQGTWGESVAVNGELCHTIDAKHADVARFASNLITAQALLGTTKLAKGNAIVQNGGSSATALAIAMFAKQQGVNVFTASSPGARYAGAASRLKAFDSQVFENTGAGLRSMRAAVGKTAVPLGLNGSGGDLVNELVKGISANGELVTFGAQNGFGISWAPSQNFNRGITLSGFFLPSYLRGMKYEERQTILDMALSTAAAQKFAYPVAEANSLDALPAVWDKTFVEGGVKGMLVFGKK